MARSRSITDCYLFHHRSDAQSLFYSIRIQTLDILITFQETTSALNTFVVNLFIFFTAVFFLFFIFLIFFFSSSVVIYTCTTSSLSALILSSSLSRWMLLFWFFLRVSSFFNAVSLFFLLYQSFFPRTQHTSIRMLRSCCRQFKVELISFTYAAHQFV